MPSSARILRFPSRARGEELSPEVSRDIARTYLDTPLEGRSRDLTETVLSNPDCLATICSLLRERREVVPAAVAAEASVIYERLSSCSELGLFDERDYFLGESAYLAGGACRMLGRREEAFRWLDRAEANYRHMINPAPSLAEVAYNRLVLRFEMGQYQDVTELGASLAMSFQKLGDDLGRAKSLLLQSKAYRQLGRSAASFEILQQIRSVSALKSDPGLLGHILLDVGEHLALDGDHDSAIATYNEALPLLKTANRPIAIAHLKALLVEALRVKQRLLPAIEAYRAALNDYAALELRTWVAYIHVVISEVLLALDRPREAEWEILAALPTIEEQKMVPEGFAAVALLKESVRRRKTDPNALRELREHLQASK